MLKKPTGTDGDEGAGGVATGREFEKGLASERSCESVAFDINVAKGWSVTESVEGASSRSVTQMITEDLPTEEASASGVGDGEAGGVEPRVIGDRRGEYPAIDTSLYAPVDGESARLVWRERQRTVGIFG